MNRSGIWKVVKIIIAIAILLYLINMVKLSDMISAIKSAKALPILAAIVLSPLNIFWLYHRWRYLVRHIDKENHINNKQVFLSVLTGATLRVTTPGGLGESGRIFYLRNVSRMKLLSLSILDGLASFSTTALFGFIGLAVTTGISWFYLGLMAYILITGTLVIFRRNLNFSRLRFLPEKFRDNLFWDTINNIPASKILVLLLMTTAMFIGYGFQYFLFINAFDTISIQDGASAVTSIMIVKSSLPISFGDLGVRESAAIYFLKQYGISEASALNASLLLFTVNLLIPAIIGSVFLWRFKLKATETAAK
ncbi:MAG: flippase-like domain-containing protein [candidate division Zixibacteria bacterium]|nr:flippase-like domain-containing protein [candidate division Zixibacteria bacterium]